MNRDEFIKIYEHSFLPGESRQKFITDFYDVLLDENEKSKEMVIDVIEKTCNPKQNES